MPVKNPLKDFPSASALMEFLIFNLILIKDSGRKTIKRAWNLEFKQEVPAYINVIETLEETFSEVNPLLLQMISCWGSVEECRVFHAIYSIPSLSGSSETDSSEDDQRVKLPTLVEEDESSPSKRARLQEQQDEAPGSSTSSSAESRDSDEQNLLAVKFEDSKILKGILNELIKSIEHTTKSAVQDIRRASEVLFTKYIPLSAHERISELFFELFGECETTRSKLSLVKIRLQKRRD